MNWKTHWASLPLSTRREILEKLGEEKSMGCYQWISLPDKVKEKIKKSSKGGEKKNGLQ